MKTGKRLFWHFKTANKGNCKSNNVIPLNTGITEGLDDSQVLREAIHIVCLNYREGMRLVNRIIICNPF